MKAIVYGGPGKFSLEEHADPVIQQETDAIVKIVKTTICGTDLHILKGDVASCKVCGSGNLGFTLTYLKSAKYPVFIGTLPVFDFPVLPSLAQEGPTILPTVLVKCLAK